MQDQIRALIESKINAEQLDVALDGNHCTITVVSKDFDGLNTVKRQQLVYGCLSDLIASGELHAVNMRTCTPDEAQ